MAIAVRAAGDTRPALVGHHHDARYDARYAPIGGGGGTGADVAITGTEGVTVVESPANTFALGLTASAAANNTIEIRADGIYAAAGAIPPEYVTDSELAAALGPYATDADLAAHAAAADPHPGYVLEGVLTTKGDLFAATAASTPARLGVGSDTQVLTADSTQASGMRWATPASGGMTNPMTTKGDLIAGGASGAATRLAVGPNGQVLTADSAQTLGVRWATPTVDLPLAGGTMAGSILVGTTNAYDLGATAARWRKLWAVDLETTNVPTIGGTSMDSRYALASALTALTSRVSALEAQMAGHTHLSGTIASMGGTAVLP